MTWPDYPSSKTAGPEWIGPIPAEWSFASLRWISRRFAGGTPDRSNISYWTEGTIPWLNSGAVNEPVVTEPSAMITAEALANSSARWVPAGSLLVALAGQGKTKGMVANLAIDSTCNQSMAAIVPDSSTIVAKYLYWWLYSQYQNIRNLAGGDLRDGLNLEHIGSIRVPLPNLPEQRAISDFLDRETHIIDELITKQERLINTLGEDRAATIVQAVTQGLHPNVEMSDSGVEWIGMIPANWNIRRMSWLFATISSGTTPDTKNPAYYEGETNWVTTGELRESYISETHSKVTTLALADHSALRIYRPGALVIAMYGATIGRLGILSEPACTNQACCVFSDPIGADSKFMFHVLYAAREHLLVLASGGGQPNINQEKLRALRVPVPDLAEQRAIAAFLDERCAKIDALIKLSTEMIGTLREYRSALITNAVTGKIDVREAV